MNSSDRIDAFLNRHSRLAPVLVALFFAIEFAALFTISASRHKDLGLAIVGIGALALIARRFLRAADSLGKIIGGGIQGLDESFRATMWSIRR